MQKSGHKKHEIHKKILVFGLRVPKTSTESDGLDHEFGVRILYCHPITLVNCQTVKQIESHLKFLQWKLSTFA